MRKVEGPEYKITREKVKKERTKKPSKRPPGRLKRRILRKSRKRQKIQFAALMAIFLFACFVAVVLMHQHYVDYPGEVDRDSVRVTGRGKDYIGFRWSASRNTAQYKVFYKPHDEEDESTDINEQPKIKLDDSWKESSTDTPEIVVDKLKDDTSYDFIIRPDSEKKEGHLTEATMLSTKKIQKVKVQDRITKLTCNKPFSLGSGAKTDVEYEIEDKSVADVDKKTGKIVAKSAGYTKIKVKATETEEYASSSDATMLEVIEANSVDAGGAASNVIYHLSPDNCEAVMAVSGAEGAYVPQALAYTGDEYIIAYGMNDAQRIISFNTDGGVKSVSKPQISLGHPNGFTYADETGLCYCVKGWSARTVTYSPETGGYGSFNLSYGCSGIAYDRKEKLLCTSSRTAMIAYDIKDYSVKYRTGVVSHKGTYYTQDCGAHAGILLRCLSDSSKHGINYIDLYDMKHGKYLGSLTCDLSEVESAVVNKDGFLEILANNKSKEDYIWRTDLNIETIGEGL